MPNKSLTLPLPLRMVSQMNRPTSNQQPVTPWEKVEELDRKEREVAPKMNPVKEAKKLGTALKVLTEGMTKEEIAELRDLWPPPRPENNPTQDAWHKQMEAEGKFPPGYLDTRVSPSCDAFLKTTMWRLLQRKLRQP